MFTFNYRIGFTFGIKARLLFWGCLLVVLTCQSVFAQSPPLGSGEPEINNLIVSRVRFRGNKIFTKEQLEARARTHANRRFLLIPGFTWWLWLHRLGDSGLFGNRVGQALKATGEPPAYLDDIVLGSHNKIDEGYWDGGTVFEWLRRQSRERGAEYVANEAVAMSKNAAGTRVESVTLKSGDVISCGTVVNASGPRAVLTSRMAGIEIPVEPRKRYTYVFSAEKPLDRDLPLTIDPSGVHVRQDGPETYLAGGHADYDPAVDYDDFVMDHSLWQDHIWPAIATRIPQFEAIKVINEWAGHYAYNTFDQNAILGPHPVVENFIFLNGFSGHGLQQSPAMGRGVAEWILHGVYRTFDLTPFHFDRLKTGSGLVEWAVI